MEEREPVVPGLQRKLYLSLNCHQTGAPHCTNLTQLHICSPSPDLNLAKLHVESRQLCSVCPGTGSVRTLWFSDGFCHAWFLLWCCPALASQGVTGCGLGAPTELPALAWVAFSFIWPGLRNP